MSTVDNRIVRMQFDNAQFEAGVMRSMKTLDALNEKLQFKEASKGLSALMVAVEGVSSKSISTAVNALDRISSYTTTILGMMAQKVKTQFADKIVSAIEAIPQRAMSQIKSGGWNRAMNIANAKFQIEGLKYSWDAVREAADYAVTDTAYGLDSAAKAASQLAASGVDFEKVIGKDGAGKEVTQMHKSLRAISGVAAMTNASYDDIAHTFTRIAGQGRVMGEDLNSLASRGLNAAATLAKSLNVTESEVRDMVSKGAINFQMFSEAMDEAYGDHAKEANKTFTGSLSNMKAALSRIGAIFTQPVIDKTNTFFVAVTSRIKEFQKALNDTKGTRITEQGLKKISNEAKKAADKLKLAGSARDAYINSAISARKKQVLEAKESLENGDVEEYSIARFATHFAEAWESAIQFASKVVGTLDLSWFQSIGSFLDKTAVKVKNFFDAASKAIDKVKASVDAASGGISDALKLDIKDLDLLHRVLQNEFGYVEERWAALDKIYQESGSTKTGKWLQGYMDQLAAVGYSFEKLGWTEEEFRKKEEEAAKSTSQLVSEMTAEELVIWNLSAVFTTVNKAMDGIKRTISSVIQSFANIGTAIIKVISSFKSFEAGLHAEDLTDRIASVAEAFSGFTKALVPTEDMLYKIASFAQDVGNVLDKVTEGIAKGAKEVLDFAASALTSEKSLEELAESKGLTSLQTTTLSVLRVVKNLWRAFTNIAKGIASVVKPIIKAFKNVFDPSGVASGVADFSEGLADFTEKLILSEEAASAVEVVFGGLFSAIQKIATIVAKAAGSITKFISSIGKAKTPTTQVSNTLSEVKETGEKTNSIFDTLKTTFEKFTKKLKELPDKFNELRDAVNQQEGVIHLKESFATLKQNIKDTIEKMKPFKKDVEEVGEAAGGTGETAIGKLASGIGIVAGKFADFIDRLPGWGTKIENFWNDLKTTVETWISNIHLDKFFDNLGDGVTQFFESDDSIIGKIKAFADKVFIGITGALEDVDWDKVGKGGILTLVAMNLFNFFKIGSGIETTIKSFASIPKNIGKIFTELGTVFTTANKSLKKITNAYIFSSIVSSLMLMVSAVIILGGMDQNELKQGIAGVIWLSVGMAIIGKAVGAILGTGDRYFNKQNIKEVDKSEKNLLQINNKLGGFIGAGILLAGLGAAIWLTAKALINLSKEMKNNAENVKSAIWNVVIILGVIAGGFLAIGLVSKFVSKSTNDGKHALGNLFGAGVLLAGLGAAIYLVVQVLKTLATEFEGTDPKALKTAFGATIAIMVLLTGFVFAAGKALEKADWKSLAMMTVTMLVAVSMVGLIAAEMVGLAYLLEEFQDSIPAGTVMAALGIMASIMLSMGTMVYLMGRGLADVDHPGALIGLVFMMGLLIAGIAAAITIMAKSLTKNNVAKETIVASVLGMMGIIAVVGIATFAIAALANNKFQGVERVRDTLLSIGAVFALVGVMALLVAESVAIIGQANWKAVAVVLLFVGAVLAVITIISKTAAKGRGAGEEIGEALFGVALAFVGIAAAALLVAQAVKVLDSVNFNGLLIPLIGLTAALALFVVGAAVIAKVVDGDAFLKVAAGMALIGATFLAAGLGIWLVAKGIEALVGATVGLVTFIKSVGDALAEHPVIFMMVVTGLIALMILVGLIIKNIGPLVDTVLQGVNTIVNFVSAGFERLTKNLKTGGDKVSKWWGDLQPKLKIGIVTGIATLCAAILQASPEMLKTIKELIKKVIFFLVDIIPMVVDGLVTILLRLINSLADSIRKNSAKIAYAFWNVIEALLEVLIDVVFEGLTLLFDALKHVPIIGKALEKLEADGSAFTKAATNMKASLRSNLATVKDYADNSEDLLTTMTGLDASMNKVTKDLKKDAIAYDNTSAGLAKMRGEAEAARVAQEKLGDSSGSMFDTLKDKAGGVLGGGGIDLGSIVPKGEIGFDFSQMGTDGNMPDMQTFMEGQGYNESDISFEAMDGGETYTDAWAAGMTTPEAQGEIQSAAADNVGVVQDELEAHKDELGKSADKGIIGPIRNKMNLANADFKNEGEKWFKSTAEGFNEGYNKYSKDPLKYMAQFGNEVNNSFRSKKGIDSNSPSKKFYQSGLWCILGFQQAIKDNTYLATGQMSSLGSSMVDAIGEPLDYVSKIASGDIEYDPRIRPVMDLSNIGRTAGDVSSMFANQNVTLSGITGQIAYDMTNLNGSNAAVVSEIQALREDMDYMTDELSNMQIVMDTGALVGSTIGAYDQAFGRRAIYGERGN